VQHSIDRIVVTGASGFLGRHLLPMLRDRYGEEKVTGLSSRDYDLMEPDGWRRMLTTLRPDVLVHLAAYSGGIGANRAYPADFYYRNTILTAHAFQFAAEFEVRKLVYPDGWVLLSRNSHFSHRRESDVERLSAAGQCRIFKCQEDGDRCRHRLSSAA